MTTQEHTRPTDSQRRVTLTRNHSGWVVSEELDSRVVRQVSYNDWHRVERALQVFDLEGAGKIESAETV